MKKSKGFTLIELLAVIVILAVIALIATPLIMNVINNAKEGAAKSSAYAYIKALEDNIAIQMTKDPSMTVPTAETTVIAGLVKSSAPSAVSLTLANGVVTAGTITVNTYSFTYANNTLTKTA